MTTITTTTETATLPAETLSLLLAVARRTVEEDHRAAARYRTQGKHQLADVTDANATHLQAAIDTAYEYAPDLRPRAPTPAEIDAIWHQYRLLHAPGGILHAPGGILHRP